MSAAIKLDSPDAPAPGEPANDNRDPDILDADEVAGMLGLGRKAVYNGAMRGEIPHRLIGRRLLFSRRALVEWLSCKSVSREQER